MSKMTHDEYLKLERFRKTLIADHLVKLTVNHYNTMIKWASTQDPKDETDYCFMKACIGMEWHAPDCAFCSFFNGECGKCPLTDCEQTPWYDVNKAGTWGEWIIAAKQFKHWIEHFGVDKIIEYI